MPLAFVLLVLAQPDPEAYDVAVVCPAALRAGLGPWIEHRTAQGHRLAVIPGDLGPEGIRQRIRQANRAGQLKYVVLMGDAEPGLDGKGLGACVPPHYYPARVNVHWGSEPLIATDNAYADLDGDGMPDVAIGRLPAHTPEVLKTLLARIVAYEQSKDFGLWRRQLNLVAGIGNLGAVIDMAVESAARYFVLRGVPESNQIGVIQANWRSPYCPDPRQYHRTVLESLNEGAMLWVFMGHSDPQSLAAMETPLGPMETLSVDDASNLRARQGPSLAVILACYAGRIDGPEDCLAEQMLVAPGGPVAVLAGSRVTMPYGMAIMGTELMRLCFQEHTPTLGEAILAAKRRMFQDPGKEDEVRRTLDMLAAAVSPQPGLLEAEKIEHVMMFNLLGDPLLRLRWPKQIEFDPISDTTAGEDITVSGTSTVLGRCTLELTAAPGRLVRRPAPRGDFPKTDEQMCQLHEDYRRANDPRWVSVQSEVPAGRFQIRLRIPQEAEGRCLVKAFVEGSDDFAAGATSIRIGRPKVEEASQ